MALCRLLLEQPDMLLLDEPTNHLDAESVWWLERYLAEFPGTVVAVTHDRYFLDNVAGWILELYQGAGIPWEGNYSSWLEQKEQRLGQEEKQASARQKTLQRELEWVRMSPRARQAKSKARITRYEELREEAERQTEGSAEILIPVPERLGDEVVIAERRGQGIWRPAPLREPHLLAAPRRDRRRDRAERRGQDHAVPDDHRPGAARRRGAHGGLDGADRPRGSEPGHARSREDGLPGDLRRPGPAPVWPPHGQRPGLLPPDSTSADPTSRRRWRPSPAASGTGCTWPSC